MTIYEKENDLGLAGTWNSLVWGSAGRPIACCNIHGYSIIKPHHDIEVAQKEEKGRGLDEEHEEDEIDDEEYHDDEQEYEQEIDIMTLEEF